MIAIYEALGASKAKTHMTFRYMMNDKLPFKMYRLEMEENKAERQLRHKT
jgi:hypothetical protein